MRFSSAAAAFLCLVATGASAADAPPLYSVTKTVPIGAPDRWDYLTFDPATHRLYVSHGTEVTVLDGTSGAVIGQIGDFPGGTHGIAVVNDAGRGYTDDGKNGLAASFDLKTLAVQKKTPAAPDADGIGYDPASGHVFVIEGDSGTITVMDPKTDTAITTIKVGGGLEFGVADGKGKFYVNGAENKELIRIDTATNTVDARWPIPDCTSPHGMAIDPASRRVFVSCVNKVMLVVDADSGKVVASLPIGAFTDAAGFDPVRKRAFSSNGDGTLSVFGEKDANNFVPLATVATAPSARTMAVDPATGRVYVAAITITKFEPSATPGGRPHVEVEPGSLRVLFLDPQ
jgi:YVTN family beta-propeller protein